MSLELRRLVEDRAGQVGVQIPAVLVDRLVIYYELLARWNRTINLTSLVDPVQAIDRLIVEPVAAAPHLPHGVRLADLGSGGGSPAIPLALALDSTHLLMVESRSRKAAFLREAARELGLNAAVEAVRFEALRGKPTFAGSADVVSLRAVRPDQPTLDLARWLTADGGTVAIFTSRATHHLVNSSTWNITPSAMLITFHVEPK